MPGLTITFAVDGSVHTTSSCTTDSAGRCTFSYSGPDLPGADVITACADNDASGTADGGEPCATATKAWVLPPSTPGQVTGGGQILNSAANDKIAFGFTAMDDQNGTKGECTVVDPRASVKVKCVDVTSLAETATHVTFFGNATINGSPTVYRIDVEDNAEPGSGTDTFRIHTASGYTASGTLTNGNIQIHH